MIAVAQFGAIDADSILTNVTLHWFTGTAGSSGRLYKEGGDTWGRVVERSTVPTGLAVFRGDAAIRRFVEREHDVVRWTEFDTGGHFAATEVPDLLPADIREFFRLVW